MTWALIFTKHAQKDAQKIVASGLKAKTQELLDIIQENPFQNPPPYEKLVGDLKGACSRRINFQLRLVSKCYQHSKPSRCCACGRTANEA